MYWTYRPAQWFIVSSEFIETIRAIEYTTEQARLMFAGRPADHVKVITVRGDSMEGTINPGDHVFVDTSVNHFDGDGVYVFVYGKTIHQTPPDAQTSLVVLSETNYITHGRLMNLMKISSMF
jgi:SOS-response transcriptional repressor LexA